MDGRDPITSDDAATVIPSDGTGATGWLSSTASSSRQRAHLPSNAPLVISGAPQSRQFTGADMTRFFSEITKTKTAGKVTMPPAPTA